MLIRVPKAEHVFIMGPQGQHLSEIMAVTGVVVSMPLLSSPVEDILLQGDEAQIGMAVQLMYMKSRAMAMQMSSAVPYHNANVSDHSHGLGRNAQLVGQCHGQYTNILAIGQSYGQHQNSQVLYQSHGQYQNSQIVGQSHGQHQNAQVLYQSHGQYQNSQIVGQSHGQHQNAQVFYQSYGQFQNAQLLGWSQNTQVVGQSHGQYQNVQIIGHSHGYNHSRGHGQYQTPQYTVQDYGKYGNPPAVGHSQSPRTLRYDNYSQQIFVGNRGSGLPVHGAPNVQPGHNVNPLKLMLTPNVVFTLQKLPVSVVHGGTPSVGRKSGSSRKLVFKDYLPTEEVSCGLKNGTIVQGSIRINPRNFEEAYLSHPDGKSDIFIVGLNNRNRALNGDEVAVQILDEGEWLINKDELESLETSFGEDDQDSRDSETEVLIKCEEVVENVESKSSTEVELDVSGIVNKATVAGQKQPANNIVNKATVAGQKQPANNSSKVNQPRIKRYISLNDLKASQTTAYKNQLTEKGEDGFKKMSQRAGRVVAIIKKKHSRTCMGFIEPMNPERALFRPTDRRTTNVMVPLSNCPKDFLTRPKDHEKTLFICRITDWKSDSVYAEGHLVKSLGDGEEIEPVTEGILIENNVDLNEYPQEAIDCLPKISPWTIPFEEFEYRRDYRTACVFTIDPATARDLDDALSCEDLGDGMFKVGVHIADVSFFVKENSVLDKVASQRSTSVYLVQTMVPMLPRLLCEQLCSLNPDEERLTFSVEWIITEHGEILEEWFGRSVIRSCVKLTYDHAQGFIEEPDREWMRDELPKISEKFTTDDIKIRVLNLHKIAVNLRKGRMDGGALRLDQVKLQYSLDPESGLPNGYSVYQQKDSNRLVEEFMLLANMAVARKINKEFPDKSLLRRHPPPKEKPLQILVDKCSDLGINIDISSAGAIHRSLNSYNGDDDDSIARMQVLVALCCKPMQNAEYFCTGCLDDESLYHHYALNVPVYTHFTSPIRRYPDVIVHRLLAASLGYCKEPSVSTEEIQELANHANDKKLAAKKVEDLSSELFFAVFVKTAGPLEETAMVMGVLDKAFDIYVLRLGVSKRVYCDKLDIKECIYKRKRKIPSLILIWNTEGKTEIRQKIMLFAKVECILEQGEKPLHWTAVIKRPQS